MKIKRNEMRLLTRSILSIIESSQCILGFAICASLWLCIESKSRRVKHALHPSQYICLETLSYRLERVSNYQRDNTEWLMFDYKHWHCFLRDGQSEDTWKRAFDRIIQWHDWSVRNAFPTGDLCPSDGSNNWTTRCDHRCEDFLFVELIALDWLTGGGVRGGS